MSSITRQYVLYEMPYDRDDRSDSFVEIGYANEKFVTKWYTIINDEGSNLGRSCECLSQMFLNVHVYPENCCEKSKKWLSESIIKNSTFYLIFI